jgi:hypothetical protein
MAWTPPNLVNGKFASQADADAFKNALMAYANFKPANPLSYSSPGSGVPGSAGSGYMYPGQADALQTAEAAAKWGQQNGFYTPPPGSGGGLLRDAGSFLGQSALTLATMPPVLGALTGGTLAGLGVGGASAGLPTALGGSGAALDSATLAGVGAGSGAGVGAGVGAATAAGAGAAGAGAAAGAGGAGGLFGLGSLGTALGISAGASLIGGLLGNDASRSAAHAQADAANNATGLQKYIFDTQQAETAPYRALGASTLPTLATYLGQPNPTTGKADSSNPNFGMLTRPFTLADVPNDPGYQFATKQANDALQNSALARGGMLSGNFATALQQQNQNMGYQQENQAFNQYWQQRGNIANLLGQATGLGQSGVGQSIGAGNNFASGASNTIQAAGNARAAGTIGSANAISGALGGIGSLAVQYPLLSSYTNFLNGNSGGVGSGGGGMMGLNANPDQLFNSPMPQS